MIIICVAILIGLNILLKSEFTEENYDGVTITVDENRISKTGITLIIKNDTDKELTFGEDYILEKKILGQWYRVIYKPSAIFRNVVTVCIETIVPKESEYTLEINLEWLCGNLKKGTYLIVKEFSVDKHKSFKLVAEFTIPTKSDKNNT